MGQSAVPAAVAPDTLLAGEDLSAANHRFLAISADHTVIRATGPTDQIIGIQDDKPFAAAGAQVGFRHLAGPALLEAGAAFSAGAYLKPDGVGRGVTASTGEKYSAIATKAGLNAGDLVAVTMEQGVVP
jgi:hypothetical protein